jgi:hypothetical protein
MAVGLILAGLALTCLGIFGWLWLCAGFRAGGWRGVLGRFALQLSALGLVYGFVRGQPINGVFLASFPPLAVVNLASFSQFSPFLGAVAWGVLPYGLGILVVSLIWRPLRVWAPGITAAGSLVAALFVGDSVSQAAMCQMAALNGAASIQRNSFLTSLAETPREVQITLHAALPEQRLGWSYRAMDWYPIPASVQAFDAGEAFLCPPN